MSVTNSMIAYTSGASVVIDTRCVTDALGLVFGRSVAHCGAMVVPNKLGEQRDGLRSVTGSILNYYVSHKAIDARALQRRLCLSWTQSFKHIPKFCKHVHSLQCTTTISTRVRLRIVSVHLNKSVCLYDMA